MICVAVLMALYSRDDPAQFRRALESVLQQDVSHNVEVRIYLGVDGEIPGALEEVLDYYADRIFLVSRSSVNLGLARTLNRLISLRQGEAYYFRMDADDECYSSRFSSQLTYLSEHPDIDVLGTAILEEQVETGLSRVVKFALDPEDARRSIARRVPVAHPTVCIRARVFDLVSQYPTHRGNEDVAMWFNCMSVGVRFDNLPQPLLRFTVSKDFWKRRSFAKAFGEFACYVRGIWSLEGWTWHYAYPVARLAVRLSPTIVSKWLYASRFRRLTTTQGNPFSRRDRP